MTESMSKMLDSAAKLILALVLLILVIAVTGKTELGYSNGEDKTAKVIAQNKHAETDNPDQDP